MLYRCYTLRVPAQRARGILVYYKLESLSLNLMLCWLLSCIFLHRSSKTKEWNFHPFCIESDHISHIK